MHTDLTMRTDVGEKYHRDHIVPLSKGGGSEPGNIQLLCRWCNLSKGNKTDAEFRAYREITGGGTR